jgi:hypothetical protein
VSLARIPIYGGKYNPDENIWKLNPQLKYFSPYSELYEKDKSEGKSLSSKMVWCIIMYCHPDDQENIFFRVPKKDRMKKIAASYGKGIDFKDETFLRAIRAYQKDSMTTIERALMLEKDKITERAELIRRTPMTFDYSDPESGKTIKGTAMQINTLQKDAGKVYEEYKKIELLFQKERQQLRPHGGGIVSVADEQSGFF